MPGGETGFFGMGFNRDEDSGRITPNDGNLALNWFFQWAFCSAAATIVSGGVAERVRFGGYAIYSLTMTGFIYPLVVSWTWGSGWLSSEVNDINFIDFAGSGVVHLTGGTGALVGAIIAGSRNGRWEYPEEFVPHSLPLVVLGANALPTAQGCSQACNLACTPFPRGFVIMYACPGVNVGCRARRGLA